VFGGHAALLARLGELGYRKDEAEELPLYYAYLLIGGLSKDKTRLRLSERDTGLYEIAKVKKHGLPPARPRPVGPPPRPMGMDRGNAIRKR
jgi:hypothetical protein